MIIGVTGGLGTGKSTFARGLAHYLKGHLIDADELAHLALSARRPCYSKIISFFGKDILNDKGLIDRAKLGKKAFSNMLYLRKLNKIIHPYVIKNIRDRIKVIYNKNKSAFIIIDAPLLIETGLHKECGLVIVVISSLSLQVERSSIYKKIRLEDALSRIRMQMPLSKKARFADYVINNNGSLQELRKGCKDLAEKIKAL
jgi:dephospho-CoA kinase